MPPPIAVADRLKIISLHETGQSYTEIQRSLSGRVSKAGISKVIQRFKETGSVLNRPKNRKKTVRTQSNIAFVRSQLGETFTSPPLGQRRLAARLGISKTSVHTIIKKDLELNCLSTVAAQKFADADREKARSAQKAAACQSSPGCSENSVQG
nr:PREDICTED: uncharacterized protein LOC106701951 [Latimeria chalumnae]XP_014339476.1 PREDICTED: uncharacterized protein LOC106701951 [Latimeria chalumnae]XP_014339479.1 PREDICTED: uncharacterized protein LOC106701951 [Latimeria chalumnae]|eukprot:XP_014339472.1 PREDICTED: uncharacterized protein LOC106701951 [Latimeria chalumnae]